MALSARRLGKAISKDARDCIKALQPYPTIDTWMNPLTRGLARHFANQNWAKTSTTLDFNYRLTDLQIANQPCLRYETENTKPGDQLILYIHGGGLVSGSPRHNAAMILPTCHLSGVEAIGVQYSLVPEARFPTQIEEVDRVYRALCKERPDTRITIFGDSMGGTLALACLLKWRDAGLPSPEGAVLISPAVDGAGESDTHKSLDYHDPVFNSNGGRNCKRLFNFYAPDAELMNEMVSPLYGDLQWLPPMLVHAGTREVLLGDAARLCEKARLADVDVRLRLFDGMFHLFHMYWNLDETKSAHGDIANFITGPKKN